VYENFYRLKRAPFHITPDPEFLYLSPTHKEALASIIYGVEKRKGFIVIVGEVGLGKTTIVRSYLERVDQKLLLIIYLFNPNVPFSALLDTIDQAAGLDVRQDNIAARVQHLHNVLIEEYRKGCNVVLVVDEAQNMPVKTLENLRMLSNLETSKDKLIQIVLVGQPEFGRMLDRNELRQLKQRIAVRATLAPLSATESLAYIQYRLEKAGAESTDIFTRGALRRIVKHARGIPRILNILCDNALITGFGYEQKPVSAAIAREVIADFEGKSGSRLWKWGVAALAALLVVGGLFFLAPPIYQAPRGPEPRSAAPSALPAPITQAPAEAKAAPRPTRTVVATRVVKPGDNLHRLAVEVYGFSGKKVVDAIVRSNPGLKNPNVLPVGTRLRFPEIADNQAAANGKAENRP